MKLQYIKKAEGRQINVRNKIEILLRKYQKENKGDKKEFHLQKFNKSHEMGQFFKDTDYPTSFQTNS